MFMSVMAWDYGYATSHHRNAPQSPVPIKSQFVTVNVLVFVGSLLLKYNRYAQVVPSRSAVHRKHRHIDVYVMLSHRNREESLSITSYLKGAVYASWKFSRSGRFVGQGRQH